MNDVHEKALERAKARQAKPYGSPQVANNMAYASERERAKEVLRSQVKAQKGENIHKIAAIEDPLDPERILTVAAYCRVSTDDLNQVMSIELQKDEYKKKICGNPKWKYYGTFVDDGYSGTNTDHRKAFQLMIDHAMAGKFDMVITKSVSRFARNLMDCVKYVNLLRKHDPPIAVYFEAEGLNSLSLSTDLVLVVLAIVAEEESHMKSEAMLLSLEWRFSRGMFMTPSLLGYDKVKLEDDGRNKRSILRVNEGQARTVRLMYYMLLNGYSTTEIATTLNDLHCWTGGRKRGEKAPNYEWTPSSVVSTLRNERYCGDVLARKTWTPNFKDHKSKKNRGKKNKYFQADHHEAIVTRAQWNATQRILNSSGRIKTYQPMRIIDHGVLCGYISMNRFWGGFTPEDYYRVASIAMGMTEGDLDADLENEYLPEGGMPLVGLASEDGILRIARELTKEEKRYQAEKNGEVYEEEEEIPAVQPIFQVVDGAMFSHAYEPVARFTKNSITFNSTCIAKFNRVRTLCESPEKDGEVVIDRVKHVEMLFNPIERMIAVRPCDADHPNAMPWCFDDGSSRGLGATSLCSVLFSIMNWDKDYSFRVPATLKCCGDDRVLFFDLDNFIGSPRKAVQEALEEEEEIELPVPEANSSIFFSADDEPQPLEDTEALQRKLDALAELEKHTFGKPAFDHDSDVRLPEGEDWDLMAEARVLDIDHTVDEGIVNALLDDLIESGAPAPPPRTPPAACISPALCISPAFCKDRSIKKKGGDTMSTQNPARSRPLSRNVVRLMKESRASPQNPKVIKAARKMGPKEIAYCEKQGDIFMTAVDLDVPVSRFAGLYMNSQVAGLLDVSFSQANGIESDEIADLIQLPMLLESPELIVALVIWLNDVVQATEEDDSAVILRALSSSATAPLVPSLPSSSTTLNEVQLDDIQLPEVDQEVVKRYEYAYWLGYIYRYECLLHEEASRMVFSVLDEPLMREMYGHLKLGNINLADCAPEICQRLDMMIVNKL